jgi:hypothetical protein
MELLVLLEVMVSHMAYSGLPKTEYQHLNFGQKSVLIATDFKEYITSITIMVFHMVLNN